MHTVRIVIGSGLALALSGISITCCFVFGQHLAPGNEGVLYGVLGGVADAFKALLPLSITAALVARERSRAVAGIVMFAVISLYSFASELGLYALSRDAVTSSASAGKEGWEMLKTERAGVQKRLASLGEAIRLPDAVRADIAGQKQLKAWEASKECTDATVAASRTFCLNIEKLKGELATAEEAEKLRAKDNELGAKLAGIDLATVMRAADAQIDTLARFTGLAPGTMRDGLAVLVAFLIELVSGMGLYVATAPGSAPERVSAAEAAPTDVPKVPAAKKAKKPEAKEDVLIAFLKSNVRTAAGGEAGAAELYDAYLKWMAVHGQGEPVLSSVIVGRKLGELGYTKAKRGGKVRWQGITLTGLRLVKTA